MSCFARMRNCSEVLKMAERMNNLTGKEWLQNSFSIWREISKTPGVLWKDGIHPVDAGNVLLMDSIIEVLGNAPGSDPGECLKVEFKEDAPLSNLPTIVPGVETTIVYRKRT